MCVANTHKQQNRAPKPNTGNLSNAFWSEGNSKLTPSNCKEVQGTSVPFISPRPVDSGLCHPSFIPSSTNLQTLAHARTQTHARKHVCTHTTKYFRRTNSHKCARTLSLLSRSLSPHCLTGVPTWMVHGGPGYFPKTGVHHYTQ